jgi:hypothetical protein
MWVVTNNIIPFKGYKAINLFGILFCRKGTVIDYVTLNHESIHTEQMKEMLFIPYYIWYIIEYLIKFFMYGSYFRAYRNVGFEREAYTYEKESDYLSKRKHFAWFRQM